MDPSSPTAAPPCVVCYEIITPSNRAVIKSCSHEFCTACIKNWTQTSISCPLCKQEFSILQHTFTPDGKCVEEEVSMPIVAPVSVVEQLNCLDHSFFSVEVARLLQAAERVHKGMWLDGRSGRGLNTVDQRNLQTVEAVCVELRNHKRRLQALLQFDPHTLLQDLYRLQGMLDQVWHRTPYEGGPPHSAPTPTPAPTRYSADDAWDGEVSDDEDLEEEMAYLAIAKSKQASKAKAVSKKKKKNPAKPKPTVA